MKNFPRDFQIRWGKSMSHCSPVFYDIGHWVHLSTPDDGNLAHQTHLVKPQPIRSNHMYWYPSFISHISAASSHTHTVQLYMTHTFSVTASLCSKSAEWLPSATRSRASNKGFANSVSIAFDWERWSLISNKIFSTDKF